MQKAPKQTTCTHYTKCKPKESKKSENWEDLFRFQICIAPLFADCHQQCDENCIPDKNTIGGSLCQPFPRSEQLWHNISVCLIQKCQGSAQKKCFWKEVIRARPEKMPKLGIPMSKKKLRRCISLFNYFRRRVFLYYSFSGVCPWGGHRHHLLMVTFINSTLL